MHRSNILFIEGIIALFFTNIKIVLAQDWSNYSVPFTKMKNGAIDTDKSMQFGMCGIYQQQLNHNFVYGFNAAKISKPIAKAKKAWCFVVKTPEANRQPVDPAANFDINKGTHSENRDEIYSFRSGYAQSWTSFGNIVYTLWTNDNDHTTHLYAYDLQQYDIQIATKSGDISSWASTLKTAAVCHVPVDDDHLLLFFNGGFDGTALVQDTYVVLLDISKSTDIKVTKETKILASMPTARHNHACVGVFNTIFSIGGKSLTSPPTEWYRKIDRMTLTTNFARPEWISGTWDVNDSHYIGSDGCKTNAIRTAVWHKSDELADIMVMSSESQKWFDVIHVKNVNGHAEIFGSIKHINTTLLGTDALTFRPNYGPLCVIPDYRPQNPNYNQPIFYQLSGKCVQSMSPLDTLNPTPSPTSTPSTSPSEQPSNAPTFTWQPTKNPTLWPSFSPTDPPTFWPTPSPTKKPSWHPTPSPTEWPTPSPTPKPTLWPTTLDPTDNPTSNPTECPTTPPAPKSFNIHDFWKEYYYWALLAALVIVTCIVCCICKCCHGGDDSESNFSDEAEELLLTHERETADYEDEYDEDFEDLHNEDADADYGDYDDSEYLHRRNDADFDEHDFDDFAEEEDFEEEHYDDDDADHADLHYDDADDHKEHLDDLHYDEEEDANEDFDDLHDEHFEDFVKNREQEAVLDRGHYQTQADIVLFKVKTKEPKKFANYVMEECKQNIKYFKERLHEHRFTRMSKKKYKCQFILYHIEDTSFVDEVMAFVNSFDEVKVKDTKVDVVPYYIDY